MYRFIEWSLTLKLFMLSTCLMCFLSGHSHQISWMTFFLYLSEKRFFKGLPDLMTRVAREEIKSLHNEIEHCSVSLLPEVSSLSAILFMNISTLKIWRKLIYVEPFIFFTFKSWAIRSFLPSLNDFEKSFKRIPLHLWCHQLFRYSAFQAVLLI